MAAARRNWGIWAVNLLLAATAFAQEAPTFRTGARLVEVQVVATVKGGQPARGLTEADFEVLENGKPQKIAFFAQPPERSVERPQPLPAGLFTNRPEYSAGSPRGVTAIVLDVLNTSTADQPFARAHIARFLKNLRGNELVAIYILGARLRVIHDFSDDPASLAKLAATLRNEWPQGGADTEELLRSEAAVFAQAVADRDAEGAKNGLDGALELNQQQRIRMTLGNLETLANHLAGISGRKSLVWVSAGVSMLRMATAGSMAGPRGTSAPVYQSYAKEFGRAAIRLADSNVAVYPIDARGLRIQSDVPIQSPLLGQRGPAFDAMWMRVPATESFSSMRYFADATGGRAVYNSNDIEGGLRRASADLEASYTLAYHTTLADDSEKRELQVRVKRRDVTVLARKRVPATPKESLLSVRDLLDSPVSATQVLLNGQVTRSGNQILVRLQIEPGNLMFTRRGNLTEGEVEVYLAQIRPTRERKVTDTKLTLRLTEEQVEKVMAEGLMFEKTLEADPAAERLRVVVRDPRTGGAGSFDAAIRAVPEK